MIRNIILFLIGILFSFNLYSAPPKISTKFATPTTSQLKSVVNPMIVADTSAPARMRIAPTVALFDGDVGYGGLLEFSFNTGSPFFIGVETGYIIFNSGMENQVTTLPILATFGYRFDLSRGSVHPYLGAAIGANLMATGENSAALTDDVSFEVLARPGVEFELSRSVGFYIEPQFGLMKGQFVSIPQAGLVFSF